MKTIQGVNQASITYVTVAGTYYPLNLRMQNTVAIAKGSTHTILTTANAPVAVFEGVILRVET